MDRGIMYAPSTMGHDGLRLPRPDPEGGAGEAGPAWTCSPPRLLLHSNADKWYVK